MTRRSDTAYESWREASQTFDYFVTGLTGALAAYVGENLEPTRLGLNPRTIEVAALAFLVAAVIVGLKRIEATVTMYRIQSKALHHEETRGALVASLQANPKGLLNEVTGEAYTRDEALTQARHHEVHGAANREKAEELAGVAESRYDWRNRLLLVGFVLLVIARILPAYVHQP